MNIHWTQASLSPCWYWWPE